ncbi:VTT domain-containing protein [Chloroflexota bacterium]
MANKTQIPSKRCNLSLKTQFLKEKVVNRKPFQISVFFSLIAVSFASAFFASSYLNDKEFVIYGYSGIFLINLICAATILVPVPGEAVNIAAGSVLNPLLVGLVASAGATLGEPTSYFAGRWGKKAIESKYSEKLKKAEYWLNRYGVFAIFLFALLPFLIFDLLGLVAGVFRYPLWKFMLFCLLGRAIRSLIETYLGWGALGFLPWTW